MDLLGHSSTLFTTILIVGALAYLGAIAFDPTHPAPRIIAGYVCGATTLAIGFVGLYYGASFEAPLALQGAYVFNALRMEWIALGLLAVVVGFLLVRQAIRRQ